MRAADSTESLSKHVCWLAFAKTLGFVFSLALPLFLVRRMDQEQYGLYKQVFLVVTTAMTVLPLAFQMSAYYFLPLMPNRRRETVANIMLFNTAVGLLAWIALLCYPALLVLIFGGPQLVPYASWIGPAILLWIVGSFLETAPIANREMQAASIIVVCIQASRALVFVAAALVYGSVRALIGAAVLHGAIQTTVLLFYLQSRFRGFWHSFDLATLRGQLAYSIPLGSAGILLIVETDFHSYFVARQFPAAIFAVYMVGTFQLPLIGLLQEAANSVLIGRVTMLQQRGRTREIVVLTARAARKLAAVYFPLYAFLLVAGREFIQLLFTSRYAQSWPVFAINLTWLPLGALLLDPLYRAYRSERFFLLRLRMGIVAALMTALALWTHRLGLSGVISAVIAAGTIERVVAAIHFGRLLGVTRRDLILLRDLGKLGVASLLAAFAAREFHPLFAGAGPLAALLLSAAVFAPCYLGTALFLRVLSAEEQAQVRDAIARFLPRPLRYVLE